MDYKTPIAIMMSLLTALTSCGRDSKDTDSSASATAQTKFFSTLTATLNCFDAKGLAQTPITANALAEETGLISQVTVPASTQGGFCNILLRGTPRPEFGARIRWTGVGPSALGLAYVAAKVPISRDATQTETLIANASFVRTFEIVGAPPQTQSQPGQTPTQVGTQPKAQTAPSPTPVPGTLPGNGSAPGDVVQALRASGAQAISSAGTYCNDFKGKPWFTNPTAVYADEYRGFVWTCRGVQVWQGACPKGANKTTASCNP
jgi:hypothetical protein